MYSSLSIILFALPFLHAADTGDLGTATSQNGLAAGSTCKAMTVIFARGTTEQGNVGTLSGPPFFASLATSVGMENVAVQGVEYPANVQGFLAGGDATGSKTMVSLVQQAMTQCPNTKVVMSGYSQGGQLVHNAAKMMDAATSAKINSVLIFGDPNNGTAVGSIPASKTLVICHDGDNICQHGDQILQPHLTYSMNADQAAKFVANAAGIASNGTGTAKPTGGAGGGSGTVMPATGTVKPAGSAKPTGTGTVKPAGTVKAAKFVA